MMELWECVCGTLNYLYEFHCGDCGRQKRATSPVKRVPFPPVSSDARQSQEADQ